MKVITYSASNGESIDLTPAQVKKLEKAGTWPKNNRGEEYCQVSHGLHVGEPSKSDEELGL